jgi:hypothetical protein
MSDYSITTDFAAKDSLSTGDANKIVKGTEITAELQAIRTAVNSKADSASPTLTGTPLAPTASSGTNTTQIATTAFVTTAFQSLYPVGSIYINASVSTNPGTLLGFGTWTAFGAGRVLVGFNSSNPLFDTAEETGGSADAIVVSHTHTDSGHSHSTYGAESGFRHPVRAGSDAIIDGSSGSVSADDALYNAASRTDSSTANISTTGSSGTNANYQPYITVYMWKRTA